MKLNSPIQTWSRQPGTSWGCRSGSARRPGVHLDLAERVEVEVRVGQRRGEQFLDPPCGLAGERVSDQLLVLLDVAVVVGQRAGAKMKSALAWAWLPER